MPLAVDPLGFSTGWSCGGLCKSTRGVPAVSALRPRSRCLSVMHDIASLQLAAKVKLRELSWNTRRTVPRSASNALGWPLHGVKQLPQLLVQEEPTETMNAEFSSERDPSLGEILAVYLEAVEAGQAPDRQQLLARYPELATQLRAFFANQDQLAAFTGPGP